MIHLIPKPLELHMGNAEVAFSRNTKLTGAFPEIYSVLASMMPNIAAHENTLTFEQDPAVPAEGYTLFCRDGNIFVRASDRSGAFYAVMSLLQLAENKGSFPEVRINDAPRYPHRGFMLDCARHFWTVAQIKKILDVLALLKMNIFHWHLSEDQGWRIEIKKYPLLTEKGSIRKSTPLSGDSQNGPRDYNEYGRGMFYTQEQVREIVAYAGARCINVIPEIDMPGHFVAAIACYPHLSCTGEEVDVSVNWGVNENIGCCGKEDIYIFVKDIIDELCELFPYPYFHIGGDEVPKDHWKVCPACQAKIKELGLKDENALQSHFNNVISAYLKSKGKHTVGWNEILESSENLDKSIIPQWWILKDDSRKELQWLADGNKMLLSSIDYCYTNLPYCLIPLEKTYGYGAASMGIEDDSNVLGIEAPLWTEHFLTFEHVAMNIFVRLAAVSEAAWTAQELKSYPDFEARIEQMRPYFDSLDILIAPQEIYRGTSLGDIAEEDRNKKSWEIWPAAPRFEVEMMHRLQGK